MQLAEGLEILVEDWQSLHEDGGTKLSVEQVMGILNAGMKKKLTTDMKAGHIAQLIINDLTAIPGALENTEKFMEEFDSGEDLLGEIDLECLLSDISMLEDGE